jgi:hypothetical protein
MKAKIKTIKVVAAILAATLTTSIYAKGGTAKPPVKGVQGPYFVNTLPDPTLTGLATDIHQFDDVGILQNVTSDGCGGTATLNGKTITVPCGMVIQMPANTLTWDEMVNGKDANGTALPSLALDGSPAGVAPAFPAFELEAVGNILDTRDPLTGNIINSKHVAGLMYISQQSLNGASGVIKNIDYTTGRIEVDTGNPLKPITVLEINDPNGRFGRVSPTTTDPRFSVDDENPTIHAGTGYPMCVPRTDPAAADDLLCPQKNRPKPPCRNFSQAGVVPPVSGELGLPVVGQVYCSQFVMKAVPNTPANALFTPTASNQATAVTDSDVREQAPFEVGDFISFSGTLMHDPVAPTDPTKDFISAHTIEANIGIYTQPGTQPSYLAIGEFGVGTADPIATAISNIPQETQDRIFLEAETTDVKTPVDIYLVDTNDPVDGHVISESNRWVTPFEMTGECDTTTALAASCFGVSGGITTQNNGPQPQRARIRATKSIPGILTSPSRNIRVVARSLCKPGTPDVSTGHSSTVDSCLASAPVFANGLVAGQYAAPVFEYIFPEGVKPGDLTVPNDFWHLPFLRYGDGSVGALTPAPW